ncbi:sensor domain-containing phosphodiesterase [Phenylobacterium sp.]|uniref:sensor domain-containing phosphodiesterase n=1 Tax=Phenylobacterium sp. TaxID=1871053 RepID=UPI002F400076
MTLGSHRLLGFAFASADLLVEIDAEGRIAFAVGASEALSGSSETKLVGRPWRDFVDPADRPMLQALFDGLRGGLRGGPVVVSLAPAGDGMKRAVSLSACQLPQNGGAISCALSRAARTPTGGMGRLHDKAAFEAAAVALFETARATGVELELAMVEMSGLAAARKGMSPDAARDAEQRISGVLRAHSHGGRAAANLGADRYALVRRRAGEPGEALAQRMLQLLSLDPQHQVRPAAATVALSAEASASQVIRALRFSLDSFIRDGVSEVSSLSLGEAVSRSMRRTLMDVGALSDAVAERNFRLVYQPVVDLKAGGALHHHEVLVRFGDNSSPFPLIRMAEELDLIEPLDLAIVERTVQRLDADPALRLAVNVSGRTIGSFQFVEKVRALIAAHPKIRNRLIFELTESAAIDDLPLADRHLQALRAEGCQICLDDFGAGAASLAYLQQLSLDVVKIDGRYIRELQHGGRESTFIRHLVTMCAELGVKTLAEMVETAQVEEAVRRAGVDFAQGWLYGPPAEQPGPPTARAQDMPPRVAARRKGPVEGWG